MKAKKLIINWEEQELVSSVNWQTWDVEIENNTKTFFLNNSSDLETAQAAVDWIANWGNSIIQYDGKSYIISEKTIWENISS